ncbi:GNAT family N-acetyltransferase [Nonomuraea pusilla]|uniref:Acetyltransferase (GNAT) family protein n=1 Tax=Nonomuraea pusilla TaxID=46177 RepID=A0A1H7U626_9ACTN|nr:GNAT family N-acetyltransferase [Nonomuraea pusilla]SEL92423.1 Acetyltransferase (GNAT) family protein [Nonomuraea pusilla]
MERADLDTRWKVTLARLEAAEEEERRREQERANRRMEEATGEWAERFRILDGLSSKNRPEQAHHLAFLAVHPGPQNQGLGTTLLHHQHARLGGLPAYLEANDPRNRDLYARHGHEAREPFARPDGALFWPIWRPGTG